MNSQDAIKNTFDENLRAAFSALTATMPCKTIVVNGKPYLRRYHVCTMPTGDQQWLHEFLTADPEPHLHGHPWTAVSRIIVGSYTEELLIPADRPNLERIMPSKKIPPTHAFASYGANDENIIYPDKIHRIAKIEPGTWTHLLVAPERLPYWEFYNPDGTRERVKTSPADWHIGCKTRDGQEPTYNAKKLSHQ